MKKELIIDSITYLLILLFSYASLSKLGDYDTFRVELSQSPLTTAYAGVISVILPSGELLIALALIAPATRLTALYASLFLLALFTAYIYVILGYSFYIPCSCGGILGRNLKWGAHFWFNMAFIIINITGILLEAKSAAVSRKKQLLQDKNVHELLSESIVNSKLKPSI
jgi:hypothetical protein